MDILKIAKNYNNKNIYYFIMLLYEYDNKQYFNEKDNIFSILHLTNEIILECQNKNLLNGTNRSIFKKKIEIILKENFVVDDRLKTKLMFLNQQLYNKNTIIVSSTCENIKEEVLKKEYFNFLVDNLILFINDNNNDNSSAIKTIFISIIIHLLYSGYTFISIIRKIKSFFSNSSLYNVLGHEEIRTDFPIDYLDGHFSKAEMSKQINNFSYIDRLNYIKNMYLIKQEKFTYVAVINGMSLDNKAVKVGKNITLYNPEKYVQFPSCSGEDIFYNNDNDKKDFYKNNINISICINAICAEAVAEKAKEKINDFINILKVYTPNDNFALDIKKSIILNSKNNVINTKYTLYNNNFEKRIKEREFFVNKFDEYFNNRDINSWIKSTMFLIDRLGKTNTNYEMILDSLKKYSEAIDSSNDQEAILKYWSSIECFFDDVYLDPTKNKDLSLIEFLSTHYVLYNRYDELHDLYKTLHLFSACNYSDNSRKTHQTICIPDSLLRKCCLLSKKKTVSLFPLTTNCSSIKNYVVDDIYISQKVNHIDRLYNQNNYAYNYFKDQISIMKENLFIIYRLRNQIIHNATTNCISCKLYIIILKKMVVTMLNAVINEFINNNAISISDVLNKIYTDDLLMLEELKKATLKNITFN